MNFASWLKFLPWAVRSDKPAKTSGRKRQRAATVRKRFIPQVEMLETRVTPSTTYTVTSDADSGTGTLRAAIASAVTGDTINFNSTLTGATGNTIDLTSGNLTISQGITINGSGSTITVNGAGLTGITKGGVFAINSTAITVTINDLTIIDGKATNGGGLYVYDKNGTVAMNNCTFSGNSGTYGGGIKFTTGNLNLADCIFSGNSASLGGGIYDFTSSALTLTDCTLAGNSATSNGGGIIVKSGTATMSGNTFSSNTATTAGGAIYLLSGTATLTNDTLGGTTAASANSAPLGGAIYAYSGTLTADDSTFGYNTASFGGGAIYDSTGSLYLANDTITGNSATVAGGGIHDAHGSVQLVSNTLTQNSAPRAAGIFTDGSEATVKLFDTIADGNTGGGVDVYQAVGTITSSGGNLYGTTSGSVKWHNTSTAGALYPDVPDTADNPMLGSLASNGGYTQTMAPISGSPALGAGNPVTTLTTDQRGFLRVVNGKIDIGAYENQGQFFTLTPPGSNPSATAGTAASFNLGSFSEIVGSSWSGSVNWGDGTTSTPTISGQGTLPATSHTYYAPGSYTVTVTLTDNYGDFASMTFGVTVGGDLIVTTLNDVDGVSPYSSPVDANGNGEISLRSALEYANANGYSGTIGFSSSLNGTIHLGSASGGVGTRLSVTDAAGLTIDGSGASITVSGDQSVGVFIINAGSSNAVTIDDLTITGGSSGDGGGIYMPSRGNLTLANDTITGNTSGGGGGISMSGGNLTLTNDTISGNIAQNGGYGGGIYAYNTTLTATDCTFTGNQATGFGGAVESTIGNLTFTDTTFNGNSADAGGAVYGNNAFLMKFTDDTLYGNSANSGGAINNYFGKVTLSSDTLTGNSATNSGGGIYSTGASTGKLTTLNSILDGNTAANGADVYFAGGTFTSSGGNLYGNTSGVTWNTSGSTYPDYSDPTGNPGLGSLQNNGGSTQTMAELPGSLALQTGLLVGKNGATPSSTDQRGFARTSNGTLDIGAFQNQSQLFTLTGPSAQTATAGTSASLNLGKFSYTGSAGNLWTVDINWGDNTADTLFSTTNQGTLPAQSHIYQGPGIHTITITVKDSYNDFAQATGTVTVGGSLTVNTTNDSNAVAAALSPVDSQGNISLRSAIEYANATSYAGTIGFTPGLNGTIALGSSGTNSDLSITDSNNLTIDGSGASITVSGANLTGVILGGVFSINTASAAVINDLSIIGGNVIFGGGGGVYLRAGTLTLSGDTISGNTALFHRGGGIYNAGGTMILTDDTISGNSAATGGGIYNAGTMALTDDTISGNTAYFQGRGNFIGAGGGIFDFSGGNLSLTNDTISGNDGQQVGGGIFSFNGNLTLTNDTVGGNRALLGGGIFTTSKGSLTLSNDTIAGNSAVDTGGGIYSSGGNLTVSDTILGGNQARAGPDISGAVTTDAGYNLVGNTSGSSGFTGPGDVLNPAFLGLGSLQNNGGPTETMALLPGSPALTMGNITGAPPTDQRGFQRVVNNKIDIGAFQNQSQLFTLTAPLTEPTVDAGQSAAFNLGSFSYSGNAGNVWKVDVNWGDGSPDTIFTTLDQGSLGTQNHAYSSTAGSPYTIQIAVSDINGDFGQVSAPSVTVHSPVVIAGPIGIPAGTAGSTYVGTTFTAIGGSGSYTFSSTGSVDGLTLTTTAGNVHATLTGTPIAVGNFAFTLTATDNNALGSASRNYTLTVSAPSLLVTNTNDAGAGSLRQAITNANLYYTNGTITFASSATGIINLASTLPQITTSMSIQGPGASLSSVMGNNQFQILPVETGTVVIISGLTISGGGGLFTNGGGILNNGGNLTLTNDIFTNNSAVHGGAVDNTGILTITNCTLANNSATDTGGAIDNRGTLTLTNDTVTKNTAQNQGGGIANGGSSYLTLINDTIANNSVGGGSGVQDGGGIFNGGTVSEIFNTILDGNTATNQGSDAFNIAGQLFTSQGGNLYGSAANSTVNITWNTTGSFQDVPDPNDNPGLGALQNNGGPTPTLAELPGSPALTKGLLAGSSAMPPATDQRGFQRIVNNLIDIGAFENQSQLFNLTPPATEPSPTVGQSAAFNLGSFTYSGSAPNIWKVTVNWGDGTADTIFTTLDQGSLGTQNHTYTAVGSYTILIAAGDTNGNFAQMSSPSVTVNPGAPASITVTAGSPQSALVHAGFATTLSATVRDQYGNPVPNVTVVFAAPTAGPSGTFSGSTSVTTNASGLATAPAFTANLLAGTYTVTASAAGVSSPANFSLTNLSPLGSSGNDIYVENVYALLLHRVADSGASYWVNLLNAGTAPATVVQDIEASTEYRDDLVQALYQHYLGRPAGSGDQSYWSGQLAGNTIESVTATILASPEYFTDASDNNTTFVQHLYQQVLGRTGSPTDVQNWVDALNSGVTRYQVAFGFLTSQEYRTDLLNGGPWVPYNPLTNWGGYYPEFLLRPADPGGLGFWLNAMQAGMSDQAVLAAIFGSNEGYTKWS